MSDMYFVVKALDKTRGRILYEFNKSPQQKSAITRKFCETYPGQKRFVLAHLTRLSKVSPELADKYRDNLANILQQNFDERDASRAIDETLEALVKEGKTLKPGKLVKTITELEQDVQDAKVARKAGEILGKVEKARRKVVRTEPEFAKAAKGYKTLVDRFKGTDFGKFLQREIKRLPVLLPDQTISRREFNKQASRTAALGSASVAKLPEQVRELASGYRFNGVMDATPEGAIIKGIQKSFYDTFQAGLTLLSGSQLTDEARKKIEDDLEKLGKQYNDLIDNLPDWAKEKYDEIGRNKISRRQFFGGKGGKYPTVDVEAQEIVDSVDNPKGQKLSPNKQGLARRNRRGIEKSIQRTITANPILPRELTNEQLFPGRKSLKGSDRFVQDALVKRQQEVLVDARTASTKNMGTKIAKGVSTTVERAPTVIKPIPPTQSAQPKLNKLFAKRLLIGSGIAALAGGLGFSVLKNRQENKQKMGPPLPFAKRKLGPPRPTIKTEPVKNEKQINARSFLVPYATGLMLGAYLLKDANKDVRDYYKNKKGNYSR